MQNFITVFTTFEFTTFEHVLDTPRETKSPPPKKKRKKDAKSVLKHFSCITIFLAIPFGLPGGVQNLKCTECIYLGGFCIFQVIFDYFLPLNSQNTMKRIERKQNFVARKQIIDVFYFQKKEFLTKKFVRFVPKYGFFAFL